MPQIVRPISDVAVGDWTPTPMYAALDEAVADDLDYIASEGTSAGEVLLAPISPPVAGDVLIRVRYARDPAATDLLSLTITLVQGTTVIATRTFEDVPGAFTESVITLTAPERALITDWTNLRLRFERAVSSANALTYEGEPLIYEGEALTYG